MKMRKMAAVSAMTIAALGLAAGTSYAEPAPAPAASDELNVALAPAINYKAFNNGTAAEISIDAGSLTVANGQLQIKDNTGIIVGGLPLDLRIDQFSVPVSAQVNGNTATLTPHLDSAVYHDVALPYQEFAPWKTPYDREQAAWSRFTSTVSLGAAIGAIVGAIGAGIVGCGLGAIIPGVGGALGFLVGAIPAGIAGCIIGMAGFAAVGTVVGAILVGAPVAIAAAIQYFTTINEPFVPPKPAG